MICAWCREPIPSSKRRDSRCCSTRCRQALHRFESRSRRRVMPGPHGAPAGPLRIAYADPPYPGKSRACYGDHPDYDGEVDHQQLVEQLVEFDGWALSTSAEALAHVLALAVAADPRARVAAWIRGARPNRRAHGALSSWEPVVYVSARSVAQRSRRDGLLVDSLHYWARARTTDPNRVLGAKPAEFCRWLFEALLVADPADTFVDLFPGSGGVARSWDVWSAVDVSSTADSDAS